MQLRVLPCHGFAISGDESQDGMVLGRAELNRETCDEERGDVYIYIYNIIHICI